MMDTSMLTRSMHSERLEFVVSGRRNVNTPQADLRDNNCSCHPVRYTVLLVARSSAKAGDGFSGDDCSGTRGLSLAFSAILKPKCKMEELR